MSLLGPRQVLLVPVSAPRVAEDHRDNGAGRVAQLVESAVPEVLHALRGESLLRDHATGREDLLDFSFDSLFRPGHGPESIAVPRDSDLQICYPSSMTNWLIALWLAIQSTPAEVRAFRAVAPTYLSSSSAALHLGAARVAGARYGIDPAVLLSIAYHESRFVSNLETRESGGRVSCGVMTPVPRARCRPEELTPLGGYLAGARHLRAWIDVCHAADHWRHDVDDEAVRRCALWAYAGGLTFRAFCEARPGKPGCDAVAKFEGRAREIRVALGIAL